MKNRNQNISSDSFTPRIPAPRHWFQAPEEIAARGFSSFIRSPRSSLPQLPSAHSWIDSAAAASPLSDFGDSRRRRSSNPGSTAVLSSNRFALSSDLHDHWRFWPLLPREKKEQEEEEAVEEEKYQDEVGGKRWVRIMILKAIGVMEMQSLFVLFKGKSGRAYHRMETEPGFDKLVHDKHGLRAVLQPLLLWAEKQIPKHAHKDTSLFLYATAGVRRLPKSDSDWLLDKAWTILKKSSFLCRRDWIKLISGMEEAYYGKFVGTEAGLNNKLQLKHPCLNNGYRDKYTCSRCASVNLDGSPLTGGKTMSKKKNGIVVELIGAPQWEECRSLARLTVNRSAGSNFSSGIDCELKPCALSDGLPQPRGKFYAMSGFYVVFQFFNLSSEASLEDVLIMGQKFCGKTWKVAKKSVAPQPFIEQYCFRAPYVASLLRDGLHIKDNQVIIGSGSITWTLGVALLKAGQALSKRVEFGSGAGSFWPPHRGKATLSSRRSQSREDLNSSLADAHVVKV
ncbi:hypothetical protein B296_00042689 [Ensete ventricosum]|uniref:Uncharacterized protein n=1 Tax=Ensete ventricosum TaxID=4639 RepID=A0A426YD08_ENSVE|nr:hypothetical protein B296_00042689 [Ensete ventricosum]